MKSLNALMEENLKDGGVVVGGGAADRFMEISEPATGKTWMCLEPVSKEDFHNLQLDENYQPFGTAIASMDAAMFQHSPVGKDTHVEVRQISGYQFAHVATAREFEFPKDPEGPVEIWVDKAHTIGFRAGREVTVMRYKAETFVELIGDDRNDESLLLPEGAYLEKLTLNEHLIVRLPTPTKTFWWFSKGRGFQGPVSL